ncbi:MAG: hypothetical protein K2X27_04265 [Candidatus Obscuribacterales bacterium]|nr:hypothetical protein [Candidatus Obscuribacterales bacterium]
MSQSNISLDDWVSRIQKIRSSKELLRALAEFRKHDWTDVERQRVSHTYMRVLDVMVQSSKTTLEKPEESSNANDGPVWYEKM